MNFCENCNFVFEQEFCPVCGSKKLREVKDNDFCFVADSKISPCEELIDTLEERDIPFSTVPYGMGSRWALPLTLFRLYVPYRFLEEAKSTLQGIENEETERLRSFLLTNQHQFNIPLKREKKIEKKLKLSEEQDFYSYCINIVESSQKIVDEGQITGCPKYGRYIFCYSENAVIAFNSQTFEILSITLR